MLIRIEFVDGRKYVFADVDKFTVGNKDLTVQANKHKKKIYNLEDINKLDVEYEEVTVRK